MGIRSRVAALSALLSQGLFAAVSAQQPIPDAPIPRSLPGGPVAPGTGSAPLSSSFHSSPTVSQPSAEPAPSPSLGDAPAARHFDDQQPSPEFGNHAIANYIVHVNEVVVPVTVKDAKGNPVSGLTWRDFTIYENNAKATMKVFSVDPAALSIAFVIDQTLPANFMAEVNQSMGAIQGALTPYDEAAVFTYTHFTKQWTGFTGGQSSRLPAVLSLAQSAGTDPSIPDGPGPLSSNCSITKNGSCIDPVLQRGGSTGGPFPVVPKEIHTLNDAILRAAKELSTRPKDRRRIIYVVSDGKEYGSRATFNDVKRYLQTNNITVCATIVGDSARWGYGSLDRFHLPFEMSNNILVKYAAATGGDLLAERGVNNMERSYAKLAAESRNQYTLLYLSGGNIIDDRYRSIDVRVDLPNVVVTAKPGYYPSAQQYK